MNIGLYAEKYRSKLLDDVIPFWLKHSPDHDCGGYFTCLDRDGTVYDMDKFMWLQGRQVWTLSKLYRCVQEKSEYLEAAKLGAEFIRDYGFDKYGRVYFALDRTGKAIEYPNNIFSDFFCAMGLAAYGAAANQDWAGKLAAEMAERIQQWLVKKESPWNKSIGKARPTEAMVYEMINVNFAQEMEELLGDPKWREVGIAAMEKIVYLHIDRDEGLVFENVSLDGSHPDTFAGRLINPGHALECLWFLISAASRWNRPDIVDAAVEAILPMLEFGWDKQSGGFFYFMDARGKPSDKLECNHKLWWVHGEALVALLLGWKHTGRDEFVRWFEKVHDYAWSRFDDPKYGEWFGYLDRDGKPYLSSKGGKWKGCFHLPRSLWLCWKILDEMKGKTNDN